MTSKMIRHRDYRDNGSASIEESMKPTDPVSFSSHPAVLFPWHLRVLWMLMPVHSTTLHRIW